MITNLFYCFVKQYSPVWFGPGEAARFEAPAWLPPCIPSSITLKWFCGRGDNIVPEIIFWKNLEKGKTHPFYFLKFSEILTLKLKPKQQNLSLPNIQDIHQHYHRQTAWRQLQMDCPKLHIVWCTFGNSENLGRFALAKNVSPRAKRCPLILQYFHDFLCKQPLRHRIRQNAFGVYNNIFCRQENGQSRGYIRCRYWIVNCFLNYIRIWGIF